MSDWKACFTLQDGKTYRVRYARPWEDIVREGTFKFNGEVIEGNRAIVLGIEGSDDCFTPGPINILEIEEQAARGEIHV